MSGSKGDTGQTGIQGFSGPKGEKGANGNRGMKGTRTVDDSYPSPRRSILQVLFNKYHLTRPESEKHTFFVRTKFIRM